MVGPLQEERKKRLAEATYDALMHSAAAMRIFGELLDGEKVAASVKADLIKFLYEQQHGKAKSKIDVDAKVGPRDALAAAIILDDGLPQQIIDGQVVEDYDDDEHDDDLSLDDDDL